MGELRCYIRWLKLSLSQIAEVFELLLGGLRLDEVKLSKHDGKLFYEWRSIICLIDLILM